jgi:hypothetical protein
MLEAGKYYWVKWSINTDWEIARWDGEYFRDTKGAKFTSSACQEHDTTPIIRK